MPSWFTDSIAAGAVIFITLRFLDQLQKFGKSRDDERQAEREERQKERQEYLATLEHINKSRDEERKAFTDAIMALVGLAQTMVNRCQSGIKHDERITEAEVVAAGSRLRAAKK